MGSNRAEEGDGRGLLRERPGGGGGGRTREGNGGLLGGADAVAHDAQGAACVDAGARHHLRLRQGPVTRPAPGGGHGNWAGTCRLGAVCNATFLDSALGPGLRNVAFESGSCAAGAWMQGHIG